MKKDDIGIPYIAQMFSKKEELKDDIKAKILLSDQSLSFKLDSRDTIKLIENLEEVSFYLSQKKKKVERPI